MYFKYSFKSGLISGVGSQDIFRENCVQKLHVKYCLAVLQSISLLTLHPVRVSQHALHCHLQFFYFSFCVVLANAWIVFLSSVLARVSVCMQSLLRLQLLCPAFPITALKQGCSQSFWFAMETSWDGYAVFLPVCFFP